MKKKQKQFTAELNSKGTMPECTPLERYLNYSVRFEVLCPIEGCTDIRCNGYDKHFDPPVQLFFCKKHKRSFYAHTSWVPVKLTQVVLLRVILGLFQGGIQQKALAQEFNLSQSTISTLVNHCQEYVEGVLNRAKDGLAHASRQLPVMLEKVIWLDETFFKIGRKSWPLILAVNANGKVVGWRLSKTRTAKDVLQVLNQVDQVMDWEVMVGDGCKVYPKALIDRKKDCFLIQHFHSKPWNQVRIHEFQILEDTVVKQTVIETSYKALSSELPQQGYALQKHHKPPVISTKKRGRPKGSKTKKKKKKQNRKLKKRGPKTLRSAGRPFKFENGLGIQFLQPEWLPQSPKELKRRTQEKTIPSLAAIQRLLWITFCIFNTGAIQSNKIESVNRSIKDLIPNRGLKTTTHYSNHFSAHFLSSQFTTQTPKNAQQPSLSPFPPPCTPSLGFHNLGAFLEPKVSHIRIQKEMRA